MSQNIFCIEIYRMCHYFLGGRGDLTKFYHVFMMTWGPKNDPPPFKNGGDDLKISLKE